MTKKLSPKLKHKSLPELLTEQDIVNLIARFEVDENYLVLVLDMIKVKNIYVTKELITALRAVAAGLEIALKRKYRIKK